MMISLIEIVHIKSEKTVRTFLCSGFQRPKNSMATRGSPGRIECYTFIKWLVPEQDYDANK